MKATGMVLIGFLFLSGCGGCQHGEESPAGGGAAAPKPGAQQPEGKIQVAPLQPALPGRAAQAPPQQAPPAAVAATPMAPAVGDVPAAAGEPDNEGDCIVVADANPDYGPPPLKVDFSAEAECSGGQPTYKWDFGDGSPPNAEANPSHTYTKPGDFTASVTVSATDGATASDEIDITVEEGEGEPQGEQQ